MIRPFVGTGSLLDISAWTRECVSLGPKDQKQGDRLIRNDTCSPISKYTLFVTSGSCVGGFSFGFFAFSLGTSSSKLFDDCTGSSRSNTVTVTSNNAMVKVFFAILQTHSKLLIIVGCGSFMLFAFLLFLQTQLCLKIQKGRQRRERKSSTIHLSSPFDDRRASRC